MVPAWVDTHESPCRDAETPRWERGATAVLRVVIALHLLPVVLVVAVLTGLIQFACWIARCTGGVSGVAAIREPRLLGQRLD
jgi:hypothetical protein